MLCAKDHRTLSTHMLGSICSHVHRKWPTNCFVGTLHLFHFIYLFTDLKQTACSTFWAGSPVSQLAIRPVETYALCSKQTMVFSHRQAQQRKTSHESSWQLRNTLKLIGLKWKHDAWARTPAGQEGEGWVDLPGHRVPRCLSHHREYPVVFFCDTVCHCVAISAPCL